MLGQEVCSLTNSSLVKSKLQEFSITLNRLNDLSHIIIALQIKAYSGTGFTPISKNFLNL